MRVLINRPALTAAAIIAAGGILAGGLALKPAIASKGSMTFTAGPITLITCFKAYPDACLRYRNNNTGFAIEGDASQSNGTAGIYGKSSNSNDAIWANSVSGRGIWSVATGSYPAIEAQMGGPGAALYAHVHGTGVAGWFDSTQSSANATVAYSNGAPAVWGSNLNGIGGDISGTFSGVVGRAPGGVGGYPIVGTDLYGTTIFYVNGNGDVYYHGGLFNFARTRSGGTATAFGSVTTSPTVEDNGTAQLVNGVATVRLDPAFAQTIDGTKAYQVMLTPDGDARGLYVSSKSMTDFVVREMQGGRSSIAFDYHIYAPALGRSGDRMALMSRGQAVGPKVPIVTPRPMKPSSVAPSHR